MIHTESENRAFHTLLGDFVENILKYSDNPGACAQYITTQIRELIGVRLVALVSAEDGADHTLVGICPQRKEAYWKRPEIQKFVINMLTSTVPRLINPGTDPSGSLLLSIGIGTSFVIPLIVGEERVGMLVLLDLMEEQGATIILEALTRIARILALILKNSLLYKNLEHTVEIRTEQLAKSEERYRRITEGLTDYLYSVRVENGRAVETIQSPACTTVTGYTPEEFNADPYLWINMVAPEDRKLVRERVQQVLSGKSIPPMEHRIIRKDGEVRWVTDTIIMLRDASGSLVSYDGVIKDITERKRAEEAEAKLEIQLHQAQKLESVGRLAGGVAHDFNNMLGVILGHAYLVLMAIDGTHPFFENLEEIRKAAERSADLTRQLLTFARKQTVSPKVLDLNSTLGGMLKMLQRLIGEDIQLTWQPAGDLWPVKVDPTQVDQILANLCVNARDAIADVGKITIETGNCILNEEYCALHAGSVPGEYVRLTVSDNGCGMDKSTLAQIFEPFYTTKGVGKGTGLGLATVYGAVKQNNGYITVCSEPGLGTTFMIYLPRYTDKAERTAAGRAGEPLTGGQETILVVEDELAILEMTTKILKNQGYTVLQANTVGEALDVARDHAGGIDLLMTDVIMPEMNGRDLAKKLKNLYPCIKSLFMSGYPADVIAQHGVLEAGLYFIQKPFSIPAMVAKVREALDS
ncbi:MAG: PAS domain S-box protein [Desulfuromonadales bacterium]|nr:PAS domain S-box protein [Desulfuromonadales bacterium]